MKRLGLEKARSRLGEAFRNFELLKEATNFDEFETRWSAILTEINASFTILTESAKGNGASYSWMGKLVEQRKSDPLLSYIWHARNANDHGIDHVIGREQGGFEIPMPSSGRMYIKNMIVRAGKIEHFEGHGYGSPIKMNFFPDKVFLVPVIDRGVTFPVPLQHMGKTIENLSPISIARFGLEYLAAKFAEADLLA